MYLELTFTAHLMHNNLRTYISDDDDNPSSISILVLYFILFYVHLYIVVISKYNLHCNTVPSYSRLGFFFVRKVHNSHIEYDYLKIYAFRTRVKEKWKEDRKKERKKENKIKMEREKCEH